ncbi:MAG: hypothetical protein GVY28_13635 [Alphaproteobacteria bacterium]|nr:hypothetical protein [Alphaproteobacteria bacterium]
MHGGREPARDRVSLLETRDGTFVADHFDKLAIRSGYLIIEDLPAGTYDLAIKPTGRKISVRVTAGAARAGYAVSDAIYLELEPHQPLTVESIEQRDGALVIRTAGGSGLGRVHLLAGRYQPAFDTFGLLAAGPIDPPYAVNPPTSRSLYVEGRDIGDEYRYILDRRDAAKYPGNMLERPGLLLNPWAVRKTDAGLQQARGGSEYLREGEDSFGVGMYGVGGEARDVDGDLAGHASLDFLRHPAGVATNLVPDEHGMVRVPLDELGDRHHLHVVVVDGDQTVYRQAVLEPKDRQFVDLRLTGGLDPDKHYTQQQKITGLAEGESLTIDDPATAEVHAIDDLADAHQLLLTLTGDGKLDEWRFILDWPTLDEAEKRSKYSEYASHELHFFLYRKDRPFFDELVRPYLENKKDKTFLDHYLLGDDLSAYAEPWAFGRLNVAERALLARRLAEQRKHIERHILDRFELLPTDPARYDRLFRAALAGRALGPASDDGEGWGFELGGIGGKAQAKSQLAADRSSTRPAPTQPPAEPVTALGVAPADTGPADGRRREALARRERAARAADAERRKQRRFYRELPKTREWAENNYHHLAIGRQLADLVNVDAFWRDYVEREGDGPFLSPHFAFATDNFTEAMFVLALLDLPFEAAEHEQAADDGAATVTAGSPMVMLHRELLPVDPAHGRTPVLVSQNFFRPDDRFEQVDGERVDKFITGEFLVDVVYGCQVVLVNPTSSRQKLDVLTQVPQGAVPVAGARYTHTRPIGLEPYSTQRIEFHFYFPEAGEFRHYPVHAAKNGRLLAAAEPVTLRAVTELSDVDTTSWAYLSQRGSAEQVVEYLKTANLARIDLSRIAWRMKDAATFRRITDLLTRRHAYDHTLWSYSVKHDHLPALRQFLKHADGVVNRVGPYLASTPLTVDPVARHLYQHLEYAPLVNARAHQLGDRRKIVNDALHAQYEAFCGLLAHKPTLDDEDRMAAAYYLLLQDRIEQGLAWLGEVDPKRLATRLQYDYFQACAAFYREDLAAARRIADRYADHPVDRWRQRFAEVANQLDQIAGAADGVVRQDDQQQAQTELAATAPALDVRVEGGQVVVDYQNLEAASINYYLMDIELLFSRRPFVQDYGEQFAYIRPNRSTRIDLPDDRNSVTFDLPAALAGRNLVVEADARGRGHRASAVHLSSALRVNLIENYGQVQVTGRDDNKPRSKVYVKVYAQRADGSTRFYKDGYTDLRGRFDYLSLNTRQLGNAEKFSLLILSQTEGAVVREAAPPKQ